MMCTWAFWLKNELPCVKSNGACCRFMMTFLSVRFSNILLIMSNLTNEKIIIQFIPWSFFNLSVTFFQNFSPSSSSGEGIGWHFTKSLIASSSFSISFLFQSSSSLSLPKSAYIPIFPVSITSIFAPFVFSYYI